MEQRRLKVMLDTNVLVDVLCPEGRPNAAFSATVFRAIKEAKEKLRFNVNAETVADLLLISLKDSIKK